MAYTVGSASVDIVPDFKNAQLAITRFFNSQPNEIKIPVTPTIDRDAIHRVEREAQQAGNGVGKALSDGASQGFNRNTLGVISREIEKLQRDIERAENNRRDATEALRLAELRRDEALKKGNVTDARRLALDLAVEKATRRIAAADELAANSTRALAEARHRLVTESQRLEDEARARSEAAQKRADDAAVAAAKRTAERIAAERLKAQRKADLDLIRQSERTAKEFERLAARDARLAVKAAQDAARENEKIKLKVEIDERQAREAGRHAGGVVTRAMREEFHQNAGLIAGAVAATLAAGAPVLLAGATTLFAGVGAVAAFQNQELRKSWLGLWGEIRTGAVSDAAVLVPAYDRMAGQIGQSFQRLRPLIRDAFDAVVPQIDSFSASLAQTAENTLPGLVAAVQNGQPVVQGFGNLLEETGTGISDFFTIIARDAPAAGQVFDELGDSLGELLPALAELLSSGVETANIVLPVLTSGFRAVHEVAEALGGVLPSLLTGFLAFRSVQGVGRVLRNWAADLGTASLQGGVFSGTQAKLAGGLTRVSRALPILGAAVALLGAAYAESEQQTSDWAQALNEGGDAAHEAALEMADYRQAVDEAGSGVGGLANFLLPAAGAAFSIYADDVDEARKRHEEWLESLTPVETAQRNLDIASRNLSEALNDEGTSAAELAGLQGQVKIAAAELRREQEQLAQATFGVTEAMVAQGDAARSLADSAFAYEDSLNDAEDALADYNDALANGTEEDKSRALLALQESYGAVANAARDVALDALPATLDATQASILADEAQLEALNNLHDTYGDLGPILENQRQELAAGVAAADGNTLAQAHLAAALEQVGISTESIPGEKSVIINAPTEEVRARLEDLGFTIEDIPGTTDVRVTANTDEAQNNIDKLDTELDDLDARNPEPTAFLNDVPFFNNARRVQAEVTDIDSQKPEPAAFLNSVPFFGEAARILIMTATIDRQNPTPEADLVDRASSGLQGILGIVNSIDGRTATVTAIYRTIYETIGSVPLIGAAFGAAGGATGGAIEGGLIQQNYDIGGAVVGRGGPLDDLIRASGPNPSIQYNIANGEHILDGQDVGLMGGQAGVYAFRDMLKAGKFGARFDGNDIRRMVENGATPSGSTGGSQRPIHITTYDNPRAIVRAMKAQQQQEAALSAIW